MSENKRKRNENHYGSRCKPANLLQSQNQLALPAGSVLHQPVIVNPVVAHGGEQFSETDQTRLLNGSLSGNQNAQSNLVYIILPPGVNQTENLLQGVQTLLLVPKEEQGSPDEGPPQLHYYLPLDEKQSESKSPDDDDVVFVKDVRTLKAEEEPEITTEYLPSPECSDPLQIQVNTLQNGSNVSFTLLPHYEEIQQPSIDGAFVSNNSNLNKVQQSENADPSKFKVQFKCDFPGCNLTFPSVYEKKIHADTHIFPANTEFKCTICNMSFERAVDRNKHVDSHAIVNTFRCKTCRKTFPYYTTLVTHINEEKCASNRSYSCHYCGVQFAEACDLEKHQKENMKYCACRAKICSEQAFELHTSLCTMYKHKSGKSKGLRVKKSHGNDDVIVLD